MELLGYDCSDETVLLAFILIFIWLHFLWETYLKYRQVSQSCGVCMFKKYKLSFEMQDFYGGQ